MTSSQLAYNGQVCYVHYMPNEILSTIFLMAIIDLTTHFKGSLTNSIEPLINAYREQIISIITNASPITPHMSNQTPLTLLTAISLVCRTWQLNVNSNPVLWSCILLTRDITDRQLVQWLAKSARQPLDIVINLTLDEMDHIRAGYRHAAHRDTSRRNTELSCALSALAIHASRWRSLVIVCTCAHDMVVIGHQIERLEGAPILETLEIRAEKLRCIGWLPDIQLRWFYNPKRFFSESHPSLKRVDLYGVPPTWGEGSIAPFVQTACIESGITTNGRRDSSLDALLRNAENLSVFSIRSQRSYIFAHDVVPLPLLTRLDIEFGDADYAHDFIKPIIAPNLRTLSLTLADDDFSAVLHRMTLWRTPTQYILQNVVVLIVKELQAGSYAIDGFLESLTRLTTITMLTTCISYNGLFERMLVNAETINTPTEDSARTTLFCPLLSTIYSRGFTAHTLKSLAIQRQAIGYPLTEIHMTIDDYAHSLDRKWLLSNIPTFSSTRFYCRF